jgi:hypothetical protein
MWRRTYLARARPARVETVCAFQLNLFGTIKTSKGSRPLTLPRPARVEDISLSNQSNNQDSCREHTCLSEHLLIMQCPRAIKYTWLVQKRVVMGLSHECQTDMTRKRIMPLHFEVNVRTIHVR